MKINRILGIAITSLVVLAVGACAAGKDWEDDFEKAKQEAAETGRPILIDFSGSDWCGWCIKLDREVLSQSAFKKYAKKELVLFLADFPQRKKLPRKTAEQNAALKKTYGVTGFPTVLLVAPDGKLIAKTGYLEGGPKAYVKHLEELLKDYERPAPKVAKETGSRLKDKSKLKDKSRLKR